MGSNRKKKRFVTQEMIKNNQRNQDRYKTFVEIGENNIVPLDINIIE